MTAQHVFEGGIYLLNNIGVAALPSGWFAAGSLIILAWLKLLRNIRS